MGGTFLVPPIFSFVGLSLSGGKETNDERGRAVLFWLDEYVPDLCVSREMRTFASVQLEG